MNKLAPPTRVARAAATLFGVGALVAIHGCSSSSRLPKPVEEPIRRTVSIDLFSADSLRGRAGRALEAHYAGAEGGPGGARVIGLQGMLAAQDSAWVGEFQADVRAGRVAGFGDSARGASATSLWVPEGEALFALGAWISTRLLQQRYEKARDRPRGGKPNYPGLSIHPSSERLPCGAGAGCYSPDRGEGGIGGDGRNRPAGRIELALPLDSSDAGGYFVAGFNAALRVNSHGLLDLAMHYPPKAQAPLGEMGAALVYSKQALPLTDTQAGAGERPLFDATGSLDHAELARHLLPWVRAYEVRVRQDFDDTYILSALFRRGYEIPDSLLDIHLKAAGLDAKEGKAALGPLGINDHTLLWRLIKALMTPGPEGQPWQEAIQDKAEFARRMDEGMREYGKPIFDEPR